MLKKLKKNKKGFTLAELLIVVAIIGVLVAISIPIFTSQLEKSREAVDEANLRNAYAEVSAAVLTEQDTAGAQAQGKLGALTKGQDGKSYSMTVGATQTEGKNWTSGSKPSIGGVSVDPSASGWTVKVTEDGVCTITPDATTPAEP